MPAQVVRTRLLPIVLVVAATVLAALATPAAGERALAEQQQALDSQLLRQINTLRAQHGLRALRLSRPLTLAATRHSVDMAVYGYFSHSSSDGTVFWRRIERYYGDQGFRTWQVGENLVWESPTLSASEALRLWLASPPHRENLLSPAWREIGISAVHSDDGRGVYRGLTPVIVTTDFGTRAPS